MMVSVIGETEELEELEEQEQKVKKMKMKMNKQREAPSNRYGNKKSMLDAWCQ